MKKWIFISLGIILTSFFIYKKSPKLVASIAGYEIGEAIDSLNNVKVYYNSNISHISGRSVRNGYNLGLKYQCVEFAKRYYYEYYKHLMPDSYGHAKDFFDQSITDGKLNKKRNLIQCTHPSQYQPKVGDLLIMDGTIFNKYGHVAIVAQVFENEIEIIQQNSGPFGNSRERFALSKTEEGLWLINKSNLLGWLSNTDFNN